MTELIIENGIIIDDAESVLCGIRELCSKSVSDLEVVKKFINNEKNTKFYIDRNLNSYMQQEPDCIYIWLDTGFKDKHGNPILISVLKSFMGFVGHVVGTVYSLADNIRSFFNINRNMMDKKVATFKKKYQSKSETRANEAIYDEKEYLIKSCNSYTGDTIFAQKLTELGYTFEEIDEDLEETDTEVVETDLTKEEEEITIGILLEKMEGMQAYMDELVAIIENINTESQTKITELQEKNEEYKRVIMQMRNFVDQETNSEDSDEKLGHDLVGGKKKILVIGGEEIGVNVMQGIAKSVGFDKKDFEFVAYDKAKGYADRIRRDGKFCAVIFGACPHKTSGNAGFSSTLEKFKNVEGMPFTADARSKSGKLKVTKESFREALNEVCINLRHEYAYGV